MKVKSRPGTKCPMGNAPKKYITDSVAVTVDDSAYYVRLVQDGSLVEEPEKKPKGGEQ